MKVNQLMFFTFLFQLFLTMPNFGESVGADFPTTDTGCKGFFYTSQFNCSAGDTQFNFCQGSFADEMNPGFYNTTSHTCYVGNGGQQSILTGTAFNVLCMARGSKRHLGRLEAKGDNRNSPPKNGVVGGIKRDHSTQMYVVVCSFTDGASFDKPGKWAGGAHAVTGGIEKQCSRWQWVTCEK